MQFNTLPFNARPFNSGPFVAPTYSDDRLVFDGFSLSDGTVMKLSGLTDSGAPREFIGGKLPSGDGEFQTDVQEGARIVTAWGILSADTIDDLETAIDDVKRNLRAKNGYLDHTQADGVVKRYVATLSNYEELFANRQYYHTTFVPWVAKFHCPYPYGVSREYLSELFSFTQADSPYTRVITNDGTADGRPVVIIVFNTATTVTAVNIKRIDATDGSTLEEIEYATTFAANDVLVFDSELYTVRRNGTKVAPTGGFLATEPGANVFKITISGTAFTADATIKHNPPYR